METEVAAIKNDNAEMQERVLGPASESGITKLGVRTEHRARQTLKCPTRSFQLTQVCNWLNRLWENEPTTEGGN